MRKVTCRCETIFDADLPEEMDLDSSPGIFEDILSGDFLAVDCPSCGTAYDSELDISQQGFFNPSATLSNWKKKYSF